MKIYRVKWRVPPYFHGDRFKDISVFWNSEAEANMHVETLIKAFTTLGYDAPASWVAKHSCNPGERFFDD